MGKKIVGMAGKVAGPKGSWRRRWSVLLSLVIAVGLAMVVKQNVMAVHGSTPFELDTPGTLPSGAGANVSTESAGSDDWDEICFAVTGDTGCGATAGPSVTATAVSWSADCPAVLPAGTTVLDCGDFDLVPAAANSSVFTGGGSKDPQPIENWLWKEGSVPQKDNLLHSFAVRYSIDSNPNCPGIGGETDGKTKCVVLYFGSDRWDNDGAAQQGFWFLQSKVTLNGAAGGGGTHFTGSHTNGDVLVISDFSQGGTVSAITVFKWNTACLGAGKPLGTCAGENLERLTPLNQQSNCYTATDNPPDAFCGVVNNIDDGEPPWPFRDAENSLTYRSNELFEAGVNLSAFPGLSGLCFSTVVAETRASPSPTATLQDFVLGSFGACTSNMVTSPLVPAGRTLTTVLPGDQVSDQVTQLTITGTESWQGTISFFVCTPSQLDDPNPLPGTTDPDNPNTCDVGGTKLGADIPVKGNPISPSLPITSTAAVTVNAVGVWCFRGEFDSGTTDVPDARDASTGECFTVTVLQPSLSTAQTWTLKDSATVTVVSGAGNLAGNLVFQLWTGSDCTSGTKIYDSGNIPISGALSVTKSTDDATSATGSLVFTATPTTSLKWLVKYTSTNGGHTNVTHACGGENSTLAINNGSTSTTP